MTQEKRRFGLNEKLLFNIFQIMLDKGLITDQELSTLRDKTKQISWRKTRYEIAERIHEATMGVDGLDIRLIDPFNKLCKPEYNQGTEAEYYQARFEVLNEHIDPEKNFTAYVLISILKQILQRYHQIRANS